MTRVNTRVKLHHFILIGLVGWGVPAFRVVGPSAILFVASATFPVWLALRRVVPGEACHTGPPTRARADLLVLTGLVSVYLLLDAVFGRQKLAINMFLVPEATATAIARTNAMVSQGRGGWELLGVVFSFAAFVLIDISRDRSGPRAACARCVAALALFYEVGISRGYALVALACIILGTRISKGRLLISTAVSLGVFFASSLARGDFADTAFANPLIDAAVWPYLNLESLTQSGCGSGEVADFVAEFAKKFVPAFIVPKTVFSFNVEMTRGIYPHFGDFVESISIFTYLGEIYFYAPSIVTATCGGLMLALLCSWAERLLSLGHLRVTRCLAGAMAIVALRSRLLDVCSLLIGLIVFLLLLKMIRLCCDVSGPWGARQRTGFHTRAQEHMARCELVVQGQGRKR